mgnify:CR=1 FL=1
MWHTGPGLFLEGDSPLSLTLANISLRLVRTVLQVSEAFLLSSGNEPGLGMVEYFEITSYANADKIILLT